MPSDRGNSVRSLFWFPVTVNNWVVRGTGVLVTLLCCISIAYYKGRTGHWTAAFLLLDFFIRLMMGSHFSPLGMLATVITSPLTPNFRPGAPKQFASFCGAVFSLVATCLYFTGYHIPGPLQSIAPFTVSLFAQSAHDLAICLRPPRPLAL